MPGRVHQIAWLTVAALWVAGVGWGFTFLLQYSFSAGAGGSAPVAWPDDSALAPDPVRPNLVVFAHPHCPCTRATVDELERLMTRCQGLVTAHVVFFRPAGFPEHWEETDTWHRAAAIPGVQVSRDTDGTEARRFRAETSGQTLLFDPCGRLLFRGGLTNARGHAGPSAGADAVESLLTTGDSGRTETLVFGCPLCDRRACQPDGDEVCPK